MLFFIDSSFSITQKVWFTPNFSQAVEFLAPSCKACGTQGNTCTLRLVVCFLGFTGNTSGRISFSITNLSLNFL